MNKKEIKSFKKEMKLDNYKLSFKRMANIFFKVTNGEPKVVSQNFNQFNVLSEELESMYIDNFKKLLSTAIDSKVFDLKFEAEDMKEILQSNDFEELVEKFGKRVMEYYEEKLDNIMLNFIEVEVMQKSVDSEEEDYRRFVLISTNNLESPKKKLSYKVKEREITMTSPLDFIINTNPLEGVIYPSFSGEGNVIYYGSKPKDLNKQLVSDFLEVNFPSTASEERTDFIKIISEICGKTLTIKKLNEIYKNIENRIDIKNVEDSFINLRELNSILGKLGYDTSNFERVTHEITSSIFRIVNIIPGKNITLTNNDDITMIFPKECISKIELLDFNSYEGLKMNDIPVYE